MPASSWWRSAPGSTGPLRLRSRSRRPEPPRSWWSRSLHRRSSRPVWTCLGAELQPGHPSPRRLSRLSGKRSRRLPVLRRPPWRHGRRRMGLNPLQAQRPRELPGARPPRLRRPGRRSASLRASRAARPGRLRAPTRDRRLPLQASPPRQSPLPGCLKPGKNLQPRSRRLRWSEPSLRLPRRRLFKIIPPGST